MTPELTRAAIAWVIADRVANQKADELETAERESARARKLAETDTDLHEYRDLKLAQAKAEYATACETEQRRDEAFRAAAKDIVKGLDL